VHQRHVGLHIENLVRELDGAVRLARGCLHLNAAHLVAPPFASPAFAAVRTNTTPFFGPGTAPRSSSRPSSGRTLYTVRPYLVTCALPIRPDMRLPVNTRPGVAAPPIAPGLRWVAWVPWLAPCPLKPCRFMVPAKPLPLVVPLTSTSAPLSKISAVSSW